MSEPLPTWLTVPPLDPTPGFEYVGALPTLPAGLRDVRFIGLTPDEIAAIRVAARLFAFAGDGIEPETRLAYARVQPLLQDIARRLAPDDDHSLAQGGAVP